MFQNFTKYLSENINGTNEVDVKKLLDGDERRNYEYCSRALKYYRKNSELKPLELMSNYANGTVRIESYEDLMLIDAIERILGSLERDNVRYKTSIERIVIDIFKIKSNGEDVLL